MPKIYSKTRIKPRKLYPLTPPIPSNQFASYSHPTPSPTSDPGFYKNLAQSSGIYTSKIALPEYQLGNYGSDLQTNILKRIAEMGIPSYGGSGTGIPSGVSATGILQGADAQLEAAYNKAATDPYSDFANIQRYYDEERRNRLNQIGGRGLSGSGEVGYQIGNLDRDVAEQRSKLNSDFIDYLSGAQLAWERKQNENQLFKAQTLQETIPQMRELYPAVSGFTQAPRIRGGTPPNPGIPRKGRNWTRRRHVAMGLPAGGGY